MRTLNRSVLPLLFLAVAGSSGTLAAQQAEGVLRMRIITVDPTLTPDLEHLSTDQLLAMPPEKLTALMTPEGDSLAEIEIQTFTIKGRRIRLDPGDGSEGYTVMDLDRRSYLAIQPSRQIYVEWSGDSADAFYADANAAADSADAHLRETGETRALHGFQTRRFESRDDDGITVAWLASEPASLQRFFAQLARATRAPTPEGDEIGDPVMAQLTARGFPVMIQTLETTGGQPAGSYVVEEVLTWEPKRVPDSVFAIPAGYQRGTVEDLVGGEGPD